ncbi:MAG TPA: Na+/H+ antiporter subunit E [Alphaproteobacteria bacterium]
MKALLPFPLLSAGLLAVWLVLNQTVSPGHVLLGGALALLGGWTMTALEPARSRIRRPRAIGRLFVLVVADVVRSNIAVARIILGAQRRSITSGFLDIPLELRNPYGLVVLACIITATPGTLWVGFDSARGILTLHILDLIDETAWIDTIKGRYERLLLEIFE